MPGIELCKNIYPPPKFSDLPVTYMGVPPHGVNPSERTKQRENIPKFPEFERNTCEKKIVFSRTS